MLAPVVTRRYAVYFDDGGDHAPTPVGPRVEATVDVLHEGQESVRVATSGVASAQDRPVER